MAKLDFFGYVIGITSSPRQLDFTDLMSHAEPVKCKQDPKALKKPLHLASRHSINWLLEDTVFSGIQNRALLSQ
jgi:hypothetical protein